MAEMMKIVWKGKNELPNIRHKKFTLPDEIEVSPCSLMVVSVLGSAAKTIKDNGFYHMIKQEPEYGNLIMTICGEYLLQQDITGIESITHIGALDPGAYWENMMCDVCASSAELKMHLYL